MKKRTSKILRNLAIVVGTIAAIIFFSLPSLRRWAESVKCGQDMIAIGFASRVWSGDNGDKLPTNFICMSNELCNPNILICPSDHSRRTLTNWDSLTADNISYEMVNMGLKQSDTNKIYIRCKIHGFVGYTDGRVVNTSGKEMHKW